MGVQDWDGEWMPILAWAFLTIGGAFILVIVCATLGVIEDLFVKCPKCKEPGGWCEPQKDGQGIASNHNYRCKKCGHIWNRSYATVEDDDGDDCDE